MLTPPPSPKEKKRALRMYLSVFRTSLNFVSLYVLLLLLLLLLNLFFIFLFVYYCPIGFFFSHEKFELISPVTARCKRVALPV